MKDKMSTIAGINALILSMDNMMPAKYGSNFVMETNNEMTKMNKIMNVKYESKIKPQDKSIIINKAKLKRIKKFNKKREHCTFLDKILCSKTNDKCSIEKCQLFRM